MKTNLSKFLCIAALLCFSTDSLYSQLHFFRPAHQALMIYNSDDQFQKTDADSAGKAIKSSYLFVEFAGAGEGISMNYDQRFRAGRSGGFGFRVGVGWIGGVITLPIGVSYLSGNGRSSLETGLSVTTGISLKDVKTARPEVEKGDLKMIPAFTLGYRLQSHNGFMLRANNSIVYTAAGRLRFIWPGLSIGYRISKN